MISTPANSVENLSGISSSPETLVKNYSSRTRATSKDMVCLVCDMCLIGERFTYNFQQKCLSSETRLYSGGDGGFHDFFEDFIQKRSSRHCHIALVWK